MNSATEASVSLMRMPADPRNSPDRAEFGKCLQREEISSGRARRRNLRYLPSPGTGHLVPADATTDSGPGVFVTGFQVFLPVKNAPGYGGGSYHGR